MSDVFIKKMLRTKKDRLEVDVVTNVCVFAKIGKFKLENDGQVFHSYTKVTNIYI